jgi:hypothetical protein
MPVREGYRLLLIHLKPRGADGGETIRRRCHRVCSARAERRDVAEDRWTRIGRLGRLWLRLDAGLQWIGTTKALNEQRHDLPLAVFPLLGKPLPPSLTGSVELGTMGNGLFASHLSKRTPARAQSSAASGAPLTAQGIGVHHEYKGYAGCVAEIDCTSQTASREAENGYTGPRVTKVTYAVDVGLPINPLGPEAPDDRRDRAGTHLQPASPNGDFLEGSWHNAYYTREWNCPPNNSPSEGIEAIIMPASQSEPGVDRRGGANMRSRARDATDSVRGRKSAMVSPRSPTWATRPRLEDR